MTENYIFSGVGHALGKYVTTNDEIERAIENGLLSGFSADRVRQSKGYKAFTTENPSVSPFSYFMEQVMGFRTRNNVVAFPPSKMRMQKAENALDLGVRAVKMALENAQLSGNDIDAWFAGNATPFEQAPGLGATIKAHFVARENQTQVATINSACVGFNVNLQRAVEYLKCNPAALHVLVVHAEVMSGLSVNKTDFVPLSTFADGAGAVVLSRVQSVEKEGVVSVINREDLFMLDFLGASSSGDLYMGASIVRERATENIAKVAMDTLAKTGWNIVDVDMLIPHQTGNAIVIPAAKKTGISLQKVYQGVQHNHGNLSGASIPTAISIISQNQQLVAGSKLLCPVAGLGGEFGAFAYIIPQKKSVNYCKSINKELDGKTAFVTGAGGDLGRRVVSLLAEKGAFVFALHSGKRLTNSELMVQNNWNENSVTPLACDFGKADELGELAKQISDSGKTVDYLVHSAAVSGAVGRISDIAMDEFQRVMQINAFSVIQLTKELLCVMSECNTVLYIGSAAEDVQFAGSSPYVMAKRALHGFAATYAPEAKKNGTYSIWYMPGIVDCGMTKILNDKQLASSLSLANQKETLNPDEVAQRIVDSLYKLKVLKTKDTYEGVLLVRRDGFEFNPYDTLNPE